MKHLLFISLLVLALTTTAGLYLYQEPAEVKTVYIEKIVEVPVEVVKTEYVVQEVIKEVIVEKPVSLRDFNSLDELYAWLDSTSGAFDEILSQRLPPSFDCDDMALMMQKQAEKDGYRMNIEVCVVFSKLHMRNLVVIGNAVYQIEPQYNSVSFYIYLDEPELVRERK